MGGTSHLISWVGFDDPAGVKLEFSIDGGAWHELGRGLTGGTFLWRLGDTTSVAVRVRVSAMGSPDIMAISRTFTIIRYTVGGTLTASQLAGTPYGLAFDGEYLWTADFGANTLRKYDRSTLALVGVVLVTGTDGEPGLFTDMAYVPERGRFYLHKLNGTVGTPGGMLYEVDKSGNVVGRWPSPCGYPTGLAWLREPNGASFLLASDRDGEQKIYLLDTTNPEFPAATLERVRPLQFGPRGATQAPGAGMFYQALTEFIGGDLRSSYAEKMTADEAQTLACVVPLGTSFSTSGYINARGIELDPADSTLWVSDANGNIYKIVSCDSRGPGSLPLGVPMPEAPSGAELAANTPNPFTLSTTIGFTIPAAGRVRLVVHDAAGRLVATLADGGFDAGRHQLSFQPEGLPAGVYSYSLLFENGAALTRRMVYLR